MSRSETKFIWGMVLAMFCWGISWPSTKILAAYGQGESIAFYRFVVTFLSLAPILLFIGEPLSIKRSGWKLLAIASLCLTIYSYFFIMGVKAGKAGAGGVLVTTMNPIFTSGLVLLLAWKKPSRKQVVGLSIGLLAGLILLRIWASWQDILQAGTLLLVGATVTWAILSRFTARSAEVGSTLSFSLWMYLICSFLMLCFTNVDENIRIIQQADGIFWLNLFFSASVTTAGATTFYFYATSKIGADKASTFIFMVPLSAALGAWLLVSEEPQWNTILGGCIGLLAVYVLNRK